MGEFEVYEDEAGEWRWRLRAANGEIVIPPESHRDPTDAIRAAEGAQRIAATATFASPVAFTEGSTDG